MKAGNKRGSYTVFIVMAFSAMLIMVYGVTAAAGKMAVSAATEDFGRIWGTSILAEYDLNLKDRYGLFGFYGDEDTVSEKLGIYAGYTFDEKAYISYEVSGCDLDGYSLTNPENFKAQIQEVVLFGIKPGKIGTEPAKGGLPQTDGGRGEADGGQTQADGGLAEAGGGRGEPYGSRSITGAWILNSLPSHEEHGRADVDVDGLAGRIKEGWSLKDLIGTSMVNQYVFTYFHHNQSGDDPGETYFKNEIEYILCGKPDDRKAKANVRRKLVALRNILNLAYLYASPEKRELVMEVALAMTPGPEAVLTQGVLMELWAFAEAENDMALLSDGQRVPLIKKDQNWALSLDNILSTGSEGELPQEFAPEGGLPQEVAPEDASSQDAPSKNKGKEGGSYIRPAEVEGASYEDYLRILINIVPEKTRLLRMMDLIQINMKYLYCDYFLMSDYYTGLRFSLQVDGVSHQFEESYERKKTDES